MPSVQQQEEQLQRGTQNGAAGFEVPPQYKLSEKSGLGKDDIFDDDAEIWLLQLPDIKKVTSEQWAASQWKLQPGTMEKQLNTLNCVGNFTLPNGTQLPMVLEKMPATALVAVLPDTPNQRGGVRPISWCASCTIREIEQGDDEIEGNTEHEAGGREEPVSPRHTFAISMPSEQGGTLTKVTTINDDTKTSSRKPKRSKGEKGTERRDSASSMHRESPHNNENRGKQATPVEETSRKETGSEKKKAKRRKEQ